MAVDNDLYEVYAIKYAEMPERRQSENFIGGDPHDMSGQLDFFVWAIKGRNHSFIVDTGFNHETAKARGRVLSRLPREGLELAGIDPKSVKDVILTHMHYDHAGTLADFPNARFHIQDEEMGFVTGRFMCHHALRHAYECEDVVTMVKKIYKDEVCFHDGDAQLAPGVSVHLIGGHAKGLMSVRVETKRGPVVLASDAAHLYANMEQQKPFPVVFNVGDMMEGWKRLYSLAGGQRRLVVPGHDPLVTQRYPALSDDLQGIVMRLDADPTV